MFQTGDEVVCLCQLGGSHDLVVIEGLIESDVAVNRIVEEKSLLKDDAHRLGEGVTIEVEQRVAVQADFAGVRVEQPHQKMSDGRLAGSRRANECDRATWSDFETHLLDAPTVFTTLVSLDGCRR